MYDVANLAFTTEEERGFLYVVADCCFWLSVKQYLRAICVGY